MLATAYTPDDSGTKLVSCPLDTELVSGLARTAYLDCLFGNVLKIVSINISRHTAALIELMAVRWPKMIRKLYAKYRALPLRKRIIYTTIFLAWHLLLLIIAIYSNKLQRNLRPLANRMDHFPGSWLILGCLIALVSIPPLFGHELLAVIAGYVYGSKQGFLILTVFSILGETGVYFCIRYKLKNYLNSFRHKHHKNYGVFVAVVEEGGILMLWFIRMSVIPPHFSTPLFSSLDNITWWKWMIANVCASPIKFFPPVFIGTLLRDKRNNSIVGDFAFALSTVITIAILWYIRRQFVLKKREIRRGIADKEMQTIVDAEREKNLEQAPAYDQVVYSMGDTQSSSNLGDHTTSESMQENNAISKTHKSRFYELIDVKQEPAYPAAAMLRHSRV